MRFVYSAGANTNAESIQSPMVPKCEQKLKGAGHCTSTKRMTSIFRHVAEAFPLARNGTILNFHRVIGIATNTPMVLNCALVTYIMMIADVGLPDAV